MTNPLFVSGEKLAAKFAAGLCSINDIKEELTKTASQENWTAHQIERVVEKTNRNILVSMQKNASKNSGDPHFTFDTLKTAEIIGMLDNGSKNKAKPSLPASSVDAAPKTFNWGNDINSGRKDRSKETNLEDYTKDGADIPSKDVGVLALKLMKDQIGLQKTDLARTDISLEGATSELGKQAEQMLLSGTPPEVLLSLPSKDIIQKQIDKVASYGTKMKKLAANTEFEIDKNHPIYKLSEYIQVLREQKFEKTANLELSNIKYKKLSDRVKGMK